MLFEARGKPPGFSVGFIKPTTKLLDLFTVSINDNSP
jgi:hypothetical protein